MTEYHPELDGKRRRYGDLKPRQSMLGSTLNGHAGETILSYVRKTQT